MENQTWAPEAESSTPPSAEPHGSDGGDSEPEPAGSANSSVQRISCLDSLGALAGQLTRYRTEPIEGLSFGDREILATLGYVPVKKALGDSYEMDSDGTLRHEVSADQYRVLVALATPSD